MEKSIKIFMSAKDANEVQRIFDTDLNASFTILNRFDLPNGEVTQLELIAESTLDIWYLAKKVEMYQNFNNRIEEKRLLFSKHLIVPNDK
jgi:hypothetical protein